MPLDKIITSVEDEVKRLKANLTSDVKEIEYRQNLIQETQDEICRQQYLLGQLRTLKEDTK